MGSARIDRLMHRVVMAAMAYATICCVWGCMSRRSREEGVVLPPEGAPGRADLGESRTLDATPQFETWLYRRPSAESSRHAFLVSPFIRLEPDGTDYPWASIELFLDADRRYVVRYYESKSSASDVQVGELAALKLLETLRGAWRVEGQVLILDDWGRGLIEVQDGKKGLGLLISRNIKSRGLLGRRVFLTYELREQGL